MGKLFEKLFGSSSLPVIILALASYPALAPYHDLLVGLAGLFGTGRAVNHFAS